MIDQIIIGDKASFDDFGASLARRVIGQPKKKVIKESVPFSNETYDFTDINGETYWEERELEYVLEMTATTPEKLEEAKIALANWLMNIKKESLHDPFIQDYHFNATYAEMDFEDDEGMDKTTATVKFTAYPYKIANYPTVHAFAIAENKEVKLAIENNSSHRIVPKIKTDNELSISINGNSTYLSEGEWYAESCTLECGVNKLVLKSADPWEKSEGEISFIEEVL